MGVADHKQHAPAKVRVFVVTVSDSRTEATDTSGRAARELVEAAGHVVAGYRLSKDEPAEVAALIRSIAAERTADVVVTSGGTGISTRDSTYEAVGVAARQAARRLRRALPHALVRGDRLGGDDVARRRRRCTAAWPCSPRPARRRRCGSRSRS